MKTQAKKRKQRPKLPPGAWLSSHGYARVYLGKSHPLSDSSGQAYWHDVVRASAGIKKRKGQHVDHADDDRRNNDHGNLIVRDHSDHASRHARETARRDAVGKFKKGRGR